MATEQEKAEKDNTKENTTRPKAGPKGTAKPKPGKATKPKASKTSSKPKQKDPAGQEAEPNATPTNPDVTSRNGADAPEVAKPKKSTKPRKKSAPKSSKAKQEQSVKPAEENKEAAPSSGDVQEEKGATEEAAKPSEPLRPKKKGRGRKKGGKKREGEQEKLAEQENTPAESNLPAAQDNGNSGAVIAEEETLPAETAKPKKKGKSRKKKPKKIAEVLPPEPPKEVPVIVQENKVVIASKNPAKVKAVELAYGRMFPGVEFIFESIPVPSGVGEQPMSDDETFAGALFRAQMAKQEVVDAGYWIGLEGGLEEIGDELHAFAWIVSFSANGIMGKSRTSTFVLPEAVSELIRDGKELGEADDIVFGQENSKQGKGAVGILTHGLVDRPQYYAEAVVMSLIPFKNPELYPPESLEKVIV